MDKQFELNLRVLKKRFPDTDSILFTCSCVQVGWRNEETNTYETPLACGPLFVVKSLGRLGVIYNIIILSQSNFNDFTDEIAQETELTMGAGGYIHYRKKKSTAVRYLFTEVPGDAENLYVILSDLKYLF